MTPRRQEGPVEKPVERILVVDDEPSIVLLARRLLSRAGYEVTGFTSPGEALVWLEGHPVDLIVVDIRMPEMDGFTFMEEARQRAPEVGFLIITAYGTLEAALEAVNRGAEGMYLKPQMENVQLVEAVRRALALHRQKQAGAQLPLLRAMLEASERLFAETRLVPLRSLVLRLLDELLGGAAALLAERDPQGGLRITAQQGDIPAWPPPQALQQALAQGALQRTAAPPGEILLAPARGKGRAVLLGVARGQRFSEAEVELVRLWARQAAVALDNARLYSDLRRAVKELEASRRRMAQAEKLAAMGRLMATIAHEVNNPLQAVRNSLHLVTHPHLPPERRQEYLTLAQRELERLEETVRRMLDYYRPEGVSRQPLNLAEVVNRVLALMAKQAQAQGVAVRNEVPKDLPWVLGNAGQLQQVVLNLVVNALDAMPEGGVLTLKAWTEGPEVVLEVADTGPGVPPEIQDRLFEPFVSSKTQGTGLGLAVSYGIVTAHQGTLTYVAPERPGQGARFRMALPQAEQAEREVAQ